MKNTKKKYTRCMFALYKLSTRSASPPHSGAGHAVFIFSTWRWLFVFASVGAFAARFGNTRAVLNMDVHSTEFSWWMYNLIRGWLRRIYVCVPYESSQQAKRKIIFSEWEKKSVKPHFYLVNENNDARLFRCAQQKHSIIIYIFLSNEIGVAVTDTNVWMVYAH